MKTLCILGLLGLYISSIRYMYKFNQKVYSKGGKWSTLNIELPDLFFTFVPIVNTVVMLMIMGEEEVLNRIFKIKK